MPQYLLHSSSQAAIRAAAESGCHFCSILVGCLTGCTGDHGAREQHRRPEDPLYISINLLDQKPGTFLLILFPCEESQILDSYMDYTLQLAPVESDTPESTPDDELTASRAQTSTYSEATAELIRSWIIQCQAEHPVCGEKHFALLEGQRPSMPGPRRLLDLQAFQTPGRIRLIEAENEPWLPYCALSYSWGRSKPYLLTVHNLSDFQKEIHLSNLPKTFQDAIEVVRGIGLRYLWADALCILQGGETSAVASEDWFDQTGKMSDIFGNSLITIAASEAHDGSQGFITSRNPLSYTICRLDLEAGLRFAVIPPCTPYLSPGHKVMGVARASALSSNSPLYPQLRPSRMQVRHSL
ncbi:uncharacterized protein A1O5_01154 [Cladophialophora psammophila CBS 110553]|uniref:Heterokaryon incompatibility domain-containing protein n=1 Tax=Cladophialophora psammophila CBS 110553 TaxID=1182543 RepID=W9XI58_9EURO|nr:uncharacterized protein A1O5_01154 [Cladophialophora psammophila CBS 110553]EXJ76646.1 hypothetical protein A1O5_01154 [Cladophialophora psammophila CBS 110553]